jgi:dihydrofolate synthase/folylpolyglutamate synthase
LDYKEIENWILNRLPFYQNSGSVAYKPGLDNINKFIKELNLSNNQLKFIHVGGTNGKGVLAHIYHQFFKNLILK